jgi:hypothetical protein
MKGHAETVNMAVDLVRLKGGCQLQYILALPKEEKGDQGNEYLKSINNQWLTNVLIRSNNLFIAFTLQAIDNVANRFCLLSWVAIVGKILPHK